MFNPNHKCVIRVASGKTNVYGEPTPASLSYEDCAVVMLDVQSKKTSVRADSSGTRGAAEEFESNIKILLAKTTKASIKDFMEVQGILFSITSKMPRLNLAGVVDHYEVKGEYAGVI